MVETGKARWHLWVVGILATVWNAFGCYMYVMAMTRNPAVMETAPPEMVAALDAAPAWSDAAWALGVWGGLAGSILLLLRSRHALAGFGVSLLGLLLTTIYEVSFGVPVEKVQSATIWGVALLLLFYAFRQRKDGVLR